jgi:hypothetical protein
MGQKDHKIGEPIKIVYQAPNKETGLTVTAEIVLPGDVVDTNYPNIILEDPRNKGVYTGFFTPDAEGEWEAIVSKPGGEGQVVKRYSVAGYNVSGVGEAVEVVDDKVDAVDGKVADVQITANDIETKVDNLTNITGGLDTPPMIS